MHNSVSSSIESFVKQEMEWICSAHDRYHIERVRTMALLIAQEYPSSNLLIIEAGALLHEALDEKFFVESDMEARERELESMLIWLWVSEQQCKQILFIIKNVGFGKSVERDPSIILPIEFQIVEDADRLEAIWAIAIARTFSYGGKKGRPIYDPNIEKKSITWREDYRKGSEHSINHFYEKLLLLKDLLHTSKAKEIAMPRHTFMEWFLEQFFRERNGEG